MQKVLLNVLFIISAYADLPNSSCHFWKHKSVFLQILHQSSMPSNIAPLYFFSSHIIWSGQSQLKSNFFRFSGVWVKICHIPHVNFEMTSPFLFKFCITCHCHDIRNFKLIQQFLLWTKGSHQSPNFVTFKCSGENLPKSSCYFSKQKSVFLQILQQSSMSWKITPLYFFA